MKKHRVKFDILLGAVIIGLIVALAWSQLSKSDNETQYDRDEFGSAWFDTDGNSCDTRNDVLSVQLENVVKQGCKVIGGKVNDPYSGQTYEFVVGGAFPIDHVVSLRDAWMSGAWKWTDYQRLLYANDLRNLQVTTRLMNEQKSDSGPDRWLPPHDQCGFVKRYSSIKEIYHLSFTTAQQNAIADVLKHC
jgi:hypothetical protein